MAEETAPKKTAPSKPRMREVGQPGYELMSSHVKELRDKELCIPKRWDTYQEMSADACVSEALIATQTFMFLSIFKGQYVSTGTTTSDIIADYINHQLHNMVGTSWAETVNNFLTHVENGLSLQEIVAQEAATGQYKGAAQLVKLAPRKVNSIYAWVWDKEMRTPLKVVQNPLKTLDNLVKRNQHSSYLGSVTDVKQFQNGNHGTSKYPILSLDKMVHMKYNPKDGNPEGNSPLNACFSSWQEKKIINKYQIIGITRDFGGLLLFRAPQDLYNNAAEDPTSPDAIALEGFSSQLSDMHVGRETHMMLSSDVHDSTNTYEYDVSLVGVEGGGKQFDISEVIKSKNSEIYSAFSAGYLNLGKDGNTGSYNQSESGFGIHDAVMEREIIHCISAIDKLAKTLLSASGYEVSFRDMPKFIPSDPAPMSAEEFGKLIQRLGSTQMLTQEIFQHYGRLAGLSDEALESMSGIDYTDKGTSRAGEGQGTSGTGSGTQQNSDSNLDNKSLGGVKHYTFDDHGDGTGMLLDENQQAIQIIEKA